MDELDRLLATLDLCDEIIDRDQCEEPFDPDFMRVIERERERIKSKIIENDDWDF